MVTSSITKNFISSKEQVEIFANVIEKSYQKSLYRASTPNMKMTHLQE